jgi:hypothetical protein
MPFCLGKYMMTTTAFYNPRTINQVQISNDITGIPSINWNFNPSVIEVGTEAFSRKPLYTISGLWMEKFLSNTSQLWCTNYNFPNTGTVVGIELQLSMLRASRIEDLVIQLTLNGELIGNNYASTINPVQSSMYTGDYMETPQQPQGDISNYGGPTDLWGTTGLTGSNIADPSFGVVISFQSNQIYPHSDIAYLSQVGLRITYA